MIARFLFRILVPSLRRLNAGVRALSSGLHHLQYRLEGLLLSSAEWFDHEIDVHWQWVARQRYMFLERGVLNTLVIRPGASVLEVCCGDGFYAHRFYAERAGQVLAVDHNQAALRHARRFHGRPNIEYRACDIRQGVPQGPFENIVWDAAIPHFTQAELATILRSIHGALVSGGVLSGYTEITPDEYSYNKLRFDGPEDLADLLAREFPHVAVFETPGAERRNLYFFASDVHRELPFGGGIRRGPVDA
jgi:SAM-dependent methyltransferase